MAVRTRQSGTAGNKTHLSRILGRQSRAWPLSSLSLCLTLQDMIHTRSLTADLTDANDNLLCMSSFQAQQEVIAASAIHVTSLGIRSKQEITLGTHFNEGRNGKDARCHTWAFCAAAAWSTSTWHPTLPNLSVSPLLMEYRSPDCSLNRLLPRSRNVCITIEGDENWTRLQFYEELFERPWQT